MEVEYEVISWSEGIEQAYDEDSLIAAFSILEQSFLSHPSYYLAVGKYKVIEICNR